MNIVTSRKKFIIGVSLIIIAYIIGYGLPVVLGLMVKNKKIGLSIAGGLWLFSWLPFLLGIALAGKEGVAWVKRKLSLLKNGNNK
ncbi:MAG: hypothetical protein QME64_02730 [bacterium]|nr:hypothetical protein [bacterium]